MKTAGLIGGMSWESTAVYYHLINKGVQKRLGGLHSAPILMHSLDFGKIEPLQRENRWKEAAQILIDSARRMEAAGADFFALCTNTMHKLADEVAASVNIPLVHIADAAAETIKSAGLERVGLLGTRFTMEEDFYKGRLSQKHGLQVIVPPQEEREKVHRVIYEELCRGRIEERSREVFRRIIANLIAHGAEGIILGCTEISLLISPQESPARLFDTTHIHADNLVNLILEE